MCDYITDTVQMINKDGQFLSHLLTKSQEMIEPWSLSYDVNTHRLWVGSYNNNKVCVYRYITRQDALTDEHRPRPDGDTRYTTHTHNKTQQLKEDEHRPRPDGDTRYTTHPHNKTQQLKEDEHRPRPDEDAMFSSTPAV